MLYEKYHEQGFEMVAFPANQFGGQAPGTSQEEREWAWRKFGVEFPVMDKIAVKYKPTPQWEGPREMSPVYGFLKSKTGGSEIEWNYTKFLVDRNGQPVCRYKPGAPLAQGLEEDLKAVLEGKNLPQKQRTYLGAA